ncbi:bifunctional 5,10-methylenetetrahydrofolate dehydrogenase/5,10-methenyltetrahydrofolate cyclohydrolase [Amnibacterium sp. CER49]|uniref:bifunctional 5,10-methylenetetrahydrofolate dehydrogenase/5,10-methenyltetrahydrofolate cyclohydrolase n=1 Tax=Amnibacterium sp. CER49 TaxID=3039161 RepID=UPI0024490248|nr:bifunctional 5,10-methylenetetrahydrofolate dehydrogenase/5,10-methenyltetrahydrofolate cyclohydrolase [Amnibacterium sp. CER49]MDH2444791.1 bifunctional 5,10-methylenetetrahydrofolate dehydrogenase/5,10-methenyltetrahydrofolate cyclohydrolase [Amnibacterium sp. CER49]
MPAELIDGKALADATLTRVTERVAALRAAGRRAPCIATVLVGDDPASHSYVRMKVNRARRVGMEPRRHDLPASTDTAGLVALIEALSADDAVDGILLQHPVPAHIDERAAFEAIAAGKDVDGVTHASFARMAFGEPGFRSATPGGILALLDAYGVPLRGTDTVVVGQGPILGRPLSVLLLAADATVTMCHVHTRDLEAQVRRADLVVAAVGLPGLIRGEWIKEGAVVIDAGYGPGGRGDVEFDVARERARLITPVPGGVGPMTVATLLAQTLESAERRLGVA